MNRVACFDDLEGKAPERRYVAVNLKLHRKDFVVVANTGEVLADAEEVSDD
jgi:hypothetical protein